MQEIRKSDNAFATLINPKKRQFWNPNIQLKKFKMDEMRWIKIKRLLDGILDSGFGPEFLDRVQANLYDWTSFFREMILMVETWVTMGEQIHDIAENMAVDFNAVNLFNC